MVGYFENVQRDVTSNMKLMEMKVYVRMMLSSLYWLMRPTNLM